jgi:molybdopterin-guanine dinucleotide biosynthesis protein A
MTISAVLLAGGESQRMGQDKATMLFRGEPLWKNQIGLLRCLEPQEILVSARSDPSWRPAGVSFVPDQKPACGPLCGIAATISQIAATHLVTLGVDMPFMSASYLRGLCGRCEFGQGAVPMIENRAEPLAAIYPREAAVDFAQALSDGNFSLQPLIRRLIALAKLRPIEVGPADQNLFRNLNEPLDVKPG